MMSNDRLEALIWVLIYGGLLVVCLGLFVRRDDAGFGWTLIAGGGAGSLLGAVMIYVRSRRP